MPNESRVIPAKTSFLWGALNAQTPNEKVTQKHVHKVLAHAFPGIKIGLDYLCLAVDGLLKPYLQQDPNFSQLENYQSDQEAIAALGDTLFIPEIRRINGCDWGKRTNVLTNVPAG